MEELRPEELEELVQELQGESGAEKALPPDVEQLLQDLEPERPMELKVEAVRQLGEFSGSNPQIVEALAAASMWDASPEFRRFAAASLLAPAHQAVIGQHPGLLPQHVKNLLREIEEGGLEEAIVEPEAVEEGLDEAPSARDHDTFHAVREAAAQALRAPVHQELLQRHPDLREVASMQEAVDREQRISHIRCLAVSAVAGLAVGVVMGYLEAVSIFPDIALQTAFLVVFVAGALVGAVVGGLVQGREDPVRGSRVGAGTAGVVAAVSWLPFMIFWIVQLGGP